ncbi:MAG TPA: SDR family oxidoreductase [Phycisphaerales bacterium]|nr:SDR family oxidoreductase [Phycisphaerales bacterium]
MELKGTTAVITGSSGRLGCDIAKALAAVGCNCVCHYNRSKQKADELIEQVQEMGVKALAVEADLTKPEEIETLFEKVVEFGVPQVLINSAAVFSRQSLAEVTFQEAQKVLNLNLIAAILASQSFAKIINDKFGNAETVVGKIINISDVGGIRPWAEYVLYCSSKAGLNGATKALAKELAPGVCVNSVAVGVVNWPNDFDESEKKRQLSFIPVGRIAKPNEITDAIIFLLENDYITGQVLSVDGGRCI